MNHHKLIIRLSLIFLLPIFSCSSKAKKIEEKTSAEAPIFSFEIDNKKLDLNYIKAGCDAVNSIATAKIFCKILLRQIADESAD